MIHKLEASVIICTYNRSASLRGLIESLIALDPIPAKWEVLVVDNNSTDDTKDLIKEFQDKLPLIYLFESRQGKTYALNKAIEHARGSLLVFTDDDVIVDRGWLGFFTLAARHFPAALWFGGRIHPDWCSSSPRPPWLTENILKLFSGYFVSHDLGSDVMQYQKNDPFPLGANLAIRNCAFQAVGAFREDLGPRGSSRGVGDETDWLSRASELGLRGVYIPASICYHYVDPCRLHPGSYFSYGYHKGRNQFRINPHHRPLVITMWIMRYILRLSRQIAKRNTPYIYLSLIGLGHSIGQFSEFIWPYQETQN